MEKFVIESSVFKNFIDDLKATKAEQMSHVESTIKKFKPGETVVVIMNKDQMGKIRIPLDLMAAEIIM